MMFFIEYDWGLSDTPGLVMSLDDTCVRQKLF